MTAQSLLREAKMRFASGHPEESIDIFTKAAATGGNPVTVYLSRGAAFIALKKFAEAETDFSRVLEIDAQNERAFYYRGISRLAQGNYKEAIADLTASLTRNHDRGLAYLARGLAFAESGREEDAVLDFKTATVFSNAEIESFMNLFGANRSLFQRSMAILDGERGPWKMVLNETEVNKLKTWCD